MVAPLVPPRRGGRRRGVVRAGKEIYASPALAFTGMMTLLDAMNRAGSADREAIRKALLETKISSDQLIMPWESIQFDQSGSIPTSLSPGTAAQGLEGRANPWREPIYRIEAGKVTPDLATLEKLAKALGVQVTELLGK